MRTFLTVNLLCGGFIEVSQTMHPVRNDPTDKITFKGELKEWWGKTYKKDLVRDDEIDVSLIDSRFKGVCFANRITPDGFEFVGTGSLEYQGKAV